MDNTTDQKPSDEKASHKKASYIHRLKAKIVDAFMIYMPILYIITYFVLGNKEAFLASDLAPFIGVFTYGVVDTILTSLKGQTPGKKAYEIATVNNDGSRLSLIKAFLRFYLFLFSAFTIIGILIPLFRKDNKALHDLLLGTKVIIRK